MKSICIFCGSSKGIDPAYAEATETLAKVFINNELDLVYGGADIGLMKIAADTILEGGGKVIGVMPEDLANREIAHKGITEMHIVNSMAERKRKMAEISDAFIMLPGGVGTLDEFFEMMSWNQLGYMKKPLGIYNVKGFFDHLLEFITHATSEKFLRDEHRENIICESNPEILIHKMTNFTFAEADEWVERLKKLGY
ncbi:TIGR00730 family Rossman fold protein [Bacteroidota bacterium]